MAKTERAVQQEKIEFVPRIAGACSIGRDHAFDLAKQKLGRLSRETVEVVEGRKFHRYHLGATLFEFEGKKTGCRTYVQDGHPAHIRGEPETRKCGPVVVS